MICTIQDRTFDGLTDIDTGRIVEDIEFRRCVFTSSSISMGMDPHRRTVVRRVRLVDCRVRASFIGGAVIDEAEVDGLETGASFYLEASAAVYRHVTLTGSIGRLMLTASAGLVPAHVQQQFDEANAAFYQTVDWALDISRAEFYECSLSGIPYRLVRRDPETQVVVRKDRATRIRWDHLQVGAYWEYALNRLVNGQHEGVVLVAPKRHPKFRESLQDLRLLQRADVADAE